MEAECPRQVVIEKQCGGLHPTSESIMAQYDDDDNDRKASIKRPNRQP